MGWAFEGNSATPPATKINVVAAITDGDFLTKVTFLLLFEEFCEKIWEILTC